MQLKILDRISCNCAQPSSLSFSFFPRIALSSVIIYLPVQCEQFTAMVEMISLFTKRFGSASFRRWPDPKHCHLHKLNRNRLPRFICQDQLNIRFFKEKVLKEWRKKLPCMNFIQTRQVVWSGKYLFSPDFFVFPSYQESERCLCCFIFKAKRLFGMCFMCKIFHQ